MGEGAHEVSDTPGPFPAPPEVVGTARQQGLGADGGILDARPLVGLDGDKERLAPDRNLGRLNLVLLRNGDCEAVGLLDGLRDLLAGPFKGGGEHGFADRIQLLVPELVTHFLPAEMFLDARPRSIEAIP